MKTYYIYKIICIDKIITDFYVGSTSNISSRKNQHKNNSINDTNPKNNLKVYKSIREN